METISFSKQILYDQNKMGTTFLVMAKLVLPPVKEEMFYFSVTIYATLKLNFVRTNLKRVVNSFHDGLLAPFSYIPKLCIFRNIVQMNMFLLHPILG